jgi:hypothetical protein
MIKILCQFVELVLNFSIHFESLEHCQHKVDFLCGPKKGNCGPKKLASKQQNWQFEDKVLLDLSNDFGDFWDFSYKRSS